FFISRAGYFFICSSANIAAPWLLSGALRREVRWHPTKHITRLGLRPALSRRLLSHASAAVVRFISACC
ncbi:MAG: hypothetical protein ACN6PY_06890, partial [Paraburkholderia nemoris]